MSILESIQSAEKQAAEKKQAALSNAREILRQAEQDSGAHYDLQLEKARKAAADALQHAADGAEGEATEYMRSVEEKNSALSEQSKAKLPAAVDAIIAKVLA